MYIVKFPSYNLNVLSKAFEMFTLKVVDCRICGDPHSVLRFAFVEFADERKLVYG